jgi:hypothetical protein|tara:strand:+ start:6735 stop:6893 length:159 start_codon:yes stop_codon:yes gene_type:complete
MKQKYNKKTAQICKKIKQKQEKDFLFQYTQEYHDLQMQLWNELTRFNKTGLK